MTPEPRGQEASGPEAGGHEPRGHEPHGLELRGGVRAAPVLGDTPAEREALRFAPDPRPRDADPAFIVGQARDSERDGIDSALVVQSSSWPDPLTVAGWALQPTTRLRVVAAHRIGTVAPTVAARTLATLHQLSGGRAGVHLILGSSDDDVHRDGDTLGKEQRYRRAGEFIEVFTRTLTAPEPFDFKGEFYDVRDAWSGVRLAPGQGPEISFAGSSDQGIALAARYADVYGIALQPPEPTRAIIGRVQAAARAHSRSLRIWRNATFVLAETADEARRKADQIAERVTALSGKIGATAADAAEWIRRYPRPNEPSTGEPRTGEPVTEGADGDGTDARAAVAGHARRVLGLAFVGTPASTAASALALHDAGVDVIQMTMPLETEADQALRRELIQELRSAVNQRIRRDPGRGSRTRREPA